jgi:uncharacterized protein YjiS (DUF1127 family)
MTCCSQPSETPLSTGWVRDGRGIRELLRAAWRSYWEHRVERAGAEFLRLLDADALHDIGMSRSELDALLGEGDARRDGDCPCRRPRQGGADSGCAHTA